jgi:O-antigen/teichoic acid export membrane protein
MAARTTVPMSVHRRIAFGAAAIAFSRVLNVLLGLAVMPVLFRHLPKEELGVWMLLAQTWAAMGILDLGFGIILTRRMALARGRKKDEMDEAASAGDLEEIADLVSCGKRIYAWLAVGAFILSWSLGWLYLGQLQLGTLSHAQVWTAWTVLCVSQAMGVWAGVWTCLLQGLGAVGWDAVIASLVGAAVLVLQIVAVLSGGGLVALSVIAAVGALVQRGVILNVARKRQPEIFAARRAWRPELLRSMKGPAFQAWLTTLGGVLVANSDQFFITHSEGATGIPAYRAAMLLVIHLHFVSGVFAGASQVFVSQLWEAGKVAEIRAILRRNALIGLLCMGCGGATILALGPTLFDWWLSPGNFAGYAVLSIILLNFTLEHHANVFSSCGRATDDEAYALPSMLSGVLKLGLAVAFLRWWGLAGLAASTLMAQAATVFWHSVWRASVRLGIDFLEHFRGVLLPCAGIFLVALGVCHATKLPLAGQMAIVQVAAVCLAGGALLGIACWFLVLQPEQRNRALARIKMSW